MLARCTTPTSSRGGPQRERATGARRLHSLMGWKEREEAETPARLWLSGSGSGVRQGVAALGQRVNGRAA